MTGREHEAQEVIADIIVNHTVEFRHGRLLPALELVAKLLVLALDPLVSPEEFDGTMLRRGHEPGAWVVWNARLRPLLESSHESILREVLGNADIAHNSRETGDEPRRLDPPDCVDGAMCLGSRHGNRLDHLPTEVARPRPPRLRLPGLPLQLIAQGLLARGLLGRKDLRREVRRLEHLADLHLSFLEWGALEPFNRLFHRPHLP